MSKIGLIVEGGSDKAFFEDYFKPNFKRDIMVLPSGTSGTCKILTKHKIHQHIKALFAKGCKQIYILVDLDTQCDNGIQFNCIVKLKKWYVSKVSLETFDNVSVVVASKEIEAWMLSAWQISNNNNKKDLEKQFDTKKSLSEKELLKRFIKAKSPIQRINNSSLDYFMSKIGI